MSLIYWLGEGLWVCCLCVCWSRGLIWNQYWQWFMVCVHHGAGTVSGKQKEICEYCWTEAETFFSFLSFFLLISPFESQTECQLISSCVALMRQPGRGDIYIRRWGWEVEPCGMKSWSSGSASLQGRRCTSTPALQHLIHALLLDRHSLLTMQPAELPQCSANSLREQDFIFLRTLCLVLSGCQKIYKLICGHSIHICWTFSITLFSARVTLLRHQNAEFKLVGDCSVFALYAVTLDRGITPTLQ